MNGAKLVLILGATSDIARAAARLYAALGCDLVLATRDPSMLKPDVADLKLRGNITVELRNFDVLDSSSHGKFLDDLPRLPDTVVCLIGLLGDQARAETDATHAETIWRSNFTSPAIVLGEIANRMAARGSGTIIGISSVAGERGRASNYIYGSAKAGFTAFLSGLRNRLVRRGVRVITVKPGFVRTRMTEGLNLPGILTSEPEEAAQAIIAAGTKGRDVIYVRPIWRWIMLVIKILPEALFKRLSL